MESNEANIDFLLEGIAKPGRYIGGERNAYRKDFDAARIRFALAFPDVYEVGLSHLGLKLLYHILNGMDGVMADRVYTPWLDFEERLRRTRQPLRALESRRSLDEFDFVGVSLQYELSYTNILTLLDLGRIPLLSKQRKARQPWIVGGGPCAFNPEPLAEVFDFLVLGEAEEVFDELFSCFDQWRSSSGDRLEFLEAVRHIPGVYVPSFFKIRYQAGGKLEAIEPVHADYTVVEKRLLLDLDEQSPLPANPLVPLIDIVHNRLGLEIARGCTRGCRFCQAGFIYRPVRERKPEKILQRAIEALRNSGYEELSLLSLSTGDYCQIQGLLGDLMSRFGDERVAVSLPSMRVGTLTPQLMELIKSVRKTGFTLAPEAGSERLRRVINKEISDEDLLLTARGAFDQGWRLLKLYFMTGLPTESEEDLESLIDLCMRVWKLGKATRAAINVSVSTFVPKPMTPFQWVGQLSRAEIESRLETFRQKLKRPGLRLKWHDPGQSLLEAVFARGDRRLGPVLLQAWRAGARFDGWTEQFDLGRWLEVFREQGIDPAFHAERERDADEVLPWDHLSARVEKRALWKEFERSGEERFTGDCRWDACSNCGVCDHKEIMPILAADAGSRVERAARPKDPPKGQFLYWFKYAKKDDARFFGQLELSRIFERAFRRAALPVAFSEGFHPHVKLSFAGALPLAMESEVEEAHLLLTEQMAPERLKDLMQSQLPAGLKIREIRQVRRRKTKPGRSIVSYHVSGLTTARVNAIVQNYPNSLDRILRKKTKRGEVSVSLGEVVKALQPLGSSSLKVDLYEKDNICFRPRPILDLLSDEAEEDFIGCRIMKVAVTPLEGDEHVGRTHHQR